MESNISELIAKLNEDHSIVSEKVHLLSTLINLHPEEGFPKIIEELKFFETFIFSVHHKREEEVLYKWMVGQNKNSDSQLIQRIIDEHNTFSNDAKKIIKDMENYLAKNNSAPIATIRYNLARFLSTYVEHMEKEESFIYLIAEGLAGVQA